MAERLDAQQWAAWWQNGTLTSFQGAFENNYDGSIKHFWNQHFSRLVSNANILDLGTGNGALALLAIQYADEHKQEFQVTGIDNADIQPSAVQGIHFLGNTPMEHTGMPTGSQDLVLSQFGFEYGEMSATLKEIKRLLKPQQGRFIAMIHHQNSAVLKQAREALQQITRCEKSNLTQTAEALIELQQQLASKGVLSSEQQQQAQQLHQRFTQGLDKLQRYARQLKDPTHTQLFVKNLVLMFDRHNAQRISPEQRLLALSRIREDQQNYRQRMRDLRAAAFSDPDFARLQQALKKLGFHIEASNPVDYAGQHFCNSLVASLNV